MAANETLPPPLDISCRRRGSGAPSGRQSGALRGDSACGEDRKSTRLNSSHTVISYAVFCLKKKKKKTQTKDESNKNTNSYTIQQTQLNKSHTLRTNHSATPDTMTARLAHIKYTTSQETHSD